MWPFSSVTSSHLLSTSQRDPSVLRIRPKSHASLITLTGYPDEESWKVKHHICLSSRGCKQNFPQKPQTWRLKSSVWPDGNAACTLQRIFALPCSFWKLFPSDRCFDSYKTKTSSQRKRRMQPAESDCVWRVHTNVSGLRPPNAQHTAQSPLTTHLGMELSWCAKRLLLHSPWSKGKKGESIAQSPTRIGEVQTK